MNWLHKPSKRYVKKEEELKQQEFFSHVTHSAQSLSSENTKSPIPRSLELLEHKPKSFTADLLPSFVNTSVADLIFMTYGKESLNEIRTSLGATSSHNTERLQAPGILFTKENRKKPPFKDAHSYTVKQNEDAREESPTMERSPSRHLMTLDLNPLPTQSSVKKVAFSDTVRIVRGFSESDSDTTPSSEIGSYGVATPTTEIREIALLSKAMQETGVTTPVKRGSSLDESPFGRPQSTKRKMLLDINQDDENSLMCDYITDPSLDLKTTPDYDDEDESPRKRPRSESVYERKLIERKQSSRSVLADRQTDIEAWRPETQFYEKVKRTPRHMRLSQSERAKLNNAKVDFIGNINSFPQPEGHSASGAIISDSPRICTPHSEQRTSCEMPREKHCSPVSTVVPVDHELQDENDVSDKEMEDSSHSSEPCRLTSAATEGSTQVSGKSSDSCLTEIIDEHVEWMLGLDNEPKLSIETLYQAFLMNCFMGDIFYTPTMSYC